MNTVADPIALLNFADFMQPQTLILGAIAAALAYRLIVGTAMQCVEIIAKLFFEDRYYAVKYGKSFKAKCTSLFCKHHFQNELRDKKYRRQDEYFRNKRNGDFNSNRTEEDYKTDFYYGDTSNAFEGDFRCV